MSFQPHSMPICPGRYFLAHTFDLAPLTDLGYKKIEHFLLFNNRESFNIDVRNKKIINCLFLYLFRY